MSGAKGKGGEADEKGKVRVRSDLMALTDRTAHSLLIRLFVDRSKILTVHEKRRLHTRDLQNVQDHVRVGPSSKVKATVPGTVHWVMICPTGTAEICRSRNDFSVFWASSPEWSSWMLNGLATGMEMTVVNKQVRDVAWTRSFIAARSRIDRTLLGE